MMKDSSKIYQLDVHTGDEASEVFIIDSQFHRVATGVGSRVPFELPDGLYTIKLRVGCNTQERLISLFEDKKVQFAPIAFSSPAPLENTGKTHEFHISNAQHHSRQVDVRLGQGSQLYVFVRIWTEKVRSSMATEINQDPCTGLTLCNDKGRVLVNFADPQTGAYSQDWEAWSACNVELDPGTYLLCLETAQGETFQQTIVTSPTWQTQIFLLQRDYGLKEADIRADLTNSSIFMAPVGQGFLPGKTFSENEEEPNLRLTEMARQAIVNKRNILTPEILGQMLDAKFNNPMLGIYGAHLWLQHQEQLQSFSQQQDRPIVDMLVENLRRLLGMAHPDVEAIALVSTLKTHHVFKAPPMLRLSWSLVLEATVGQPTLVPQASLAAQMAGQLCSSDLWLVWLSTPKQAGEEELVQQLKKLAQTEVTNLPPGQVIAMTGKKGKSAIALQSMPQLASDAPVSYSHIPKKKSSKEKLLRMVQVLGLPRSKIEGLLKGVNKKEPQAPSTLKTDDQGKEKKKPKANQ